MSVGVAHVLHCVYTGRSSYGGRAGVGAGVAPHSQIKIYIPAATIGAALAHRLYVTAAAQINN